MVGKRRTSPLGGVGDGGGNESGCRYLYMGTSTALLAGWRLLL